MASQVHSLAKESFKCLNEQMTAPRLVEIENRSYLKKNMEETSNKDARLDLVISRVRNASEFFFLHLE